MKKLTYVMVPLFVVTGLAGLAYSGGGPNPTGGCQYLYFNVLGGGVPSEGGLPKNQGTTLLGQFIATQQIGSGNVIVQMQIAKGNVWYSYEFTVSSTTSLCDPLLTDELLLDQYFLWPCEFNFASEVMPAPPAGYAYAAFAVSLFTKGFDCTNPGTAFPPENTETLPTYVDGAYSKATRWGDVKLKFVLIKLP